MATQAKMSYLNASGESNIDETFFYAKSAFWLKRDEAISLVFSKGQEAIYSAWGWVIDDDDGYQVLLPLGRLWTHGNQEERTFSNSEFDSLLLIIELDSVTDVRPATRFQFTTTNAGNTLYSADEINLGIGTYDQSRSFSYLSDEVPRFGLPDDGLAIDKYPTKHITVGGVTLTAPTLWQMSSSPEFVTSMLPDYLYVISSPSGKDLSGLESDLPQLEISSEQLAFTQSHKNAWIWIETDNANCQSRSFYTYESDLVYVEWVVRLNCRIRDAYSDTGPESRQTQAAPLIQILVSRPLDSAPDDWPEPLLRINFTPGTQEDLLFLKEMVLSLRPAG